VEFNRIYLSPYSPLKTKRQIKRIGPTGFHKKQMANVDFVKKTRSDSPTESSETDIFKMLEFLIDNIFFM
jgi:hypothetical protein